jgi:hypothetical protein
LFERLLEIRTAQGHARGPGVYLLPSSAFFAIRS